MARPRSRARGPRPSRRLVTLSVAFGLFVLADLALFGWLIFRSLSQREIEQVLLETRREAEGLAAQLAETAAETGDLYTAVASQQETQTYIDSLPVQRKLVRSVRILDRQGQLVFESRTETVESTADAPGVGPADPDLGLGGPGISMDSPEVPLDGEVVTIVDPPRTVELEVPDIEVAIGELGTLVVGLSPVELSARIAVLRSHLIRQASVVAALTAALLAFAYAAIWWLSRRSHRLELQAAEAERLAYLGTLASGLAHEIRNPLNSLNLNMQMMQEEIAAGEAEGPTAGRLLAITRDEISRLERLVTDFLSYARPRTPDVSEVRPAELFERVREVLAGALQRQRARLDVEDATGGAVLSVDVSQLSQLLLNLVQNALAAAEDTGEPARILLRAVRRGTEVALEVHDRGPGIPEEARERIFDLFYSTRRGGTGLGLAIVRRIAQNHGGRVEVESEVGRGTVFRVWLPEGGVA